MSTAFHAVMHRRVRSRQARAVVAALLLLPGATGCYTYRPLWNGTPTPGSEVALALTDRGRVALSGPLGPGALEVAGRVADLTDSAYVLRVSHVRYIGTSASAKWSGEPLTVAREYVGATRERQLSKSRSWLAAGLTVGVIGLMTTLVLNGGGGAPGSGRDGGGGPNQQ